MSMPRYLVVSVSCLFLAGLALCSVALAQPRQATNQLELDNLSSLFRQRLEARRGPLFHELLDSQEPAQSALNRDPDIKLMYVEHGRPFYYLAQNLTAARTISTFNVWPGGGSGYSLTGSGTTLGELAIWDAGGVRLTHQELTGRVTQIDSPAATHYHATHVAGTMIATGVTANAKGMSYQANLAAYDWDFDETEAAAAAAAGLNVSNHSYSLITGWYQSGDWYWFGDTNVSTTEDYYFGFYDAQAQDWDQIAYNAPYYSICTSAGNDRDDAGPGPGGGHWVWDDGVGNWVWSTATRDPDGGATGYDCVNHRGVAKNVITVGAVYDIPLGYFSPADVVAALFTCWGPTDDGRIKPDFVANGIGLYSCTDASDTAYGIYSGTSMSTPNLSGSLNLLVRHYEDTHGSTTPRSSTMKALLIQSADESGPNDGPDYSFGWGLMNTRKAADLISADTASAIRMHEDFLANGEEDSLYLVCDGATTVRFTIAWTDPPGTPTAPALDPTTPMLVNDLDMRLEHLATSTEYMPWTLNPASPSSPASRGDNVRDNVEQIQAIPIPGAYVLRVKHKGTLSTNQYYSLGSSTPLTATADATPPSITVTDPNGGETLVAGTQYEITWTATDESGVDSVDILYSTNNGASFDTVALGEDNDSSYMWTVPGTLSDQYLVRIVAYDPFLNTNQDDSDAVFEVVPPHPVPTLKRSGQLLLAALIVAMAVILLLRARRRATERS
ncbi:MAG: S8 family serine peptidase [Candidatus Eiseniibacteriota bacterium]|nr:MAG: S8 family serine peptidase [Candidatus Eisenbacteria bacterium]